MNSGVYLSSSKHLVSNSEKIKKSDLPICLVDMKIESKHIDKKKLKHILQQNTQIIIDENSIYIGKDIKGPNSTLLKYEITDRDLHGEYFLKRWIITKLLILEFNIYNKKSRYILTLSGIWDGTEKTWSFIQIQNKKALVIEQ